MPHIKFHNFTEDEVVTIFENTVTKLSKAIDSPVDWFQYINLNSKITIETTTDTKVCYVIVDWFKRADAVKKEVVDILDQEIRKHGFSEVVIYFNDLEKTNYFEDGSSF